MLTVVCWKWGKLFGPEYVNRLKNAVKRNLQLPHEFVCVTDDPHGLDTDVGTVWLPREWSTSPRCIRRLRIYDRLFAKRLGDRILAIDLDVIITGDITPLVDTLARTKFWRVGYANVLSGSFQLFDAGEPLNLWNWFSANPLAVFSQVSRPNYQGSDQDVLNAWFANRETDEWTDAMGFQVYFGKGYERFLKGRSQDELPEGTRLVVMGSEDKHVIDTGGHPWIVEHWR